MTLNEATVEHAALEWFEALDYATAYGPHLAPGEAEAERESFGDVVLTERLHEAIQRFNPLFPAGVLEMARYNQLLQPSSLRQGSA